MSARNHHPGGSPAAVTGRRLAELLALRPAYRRRWQRHAVQYRLTEVHQAAVARVLARHLLRSGRLTGDETLLARRLKDLVGRALGGVVLSPQTLALFVEAFAMTASDAEELSALLAARDSSGSRGPRPGAGPGPGPGPGEVPPPVGSRDRAGAARRTPTGAWNRPPGSDGLPAGHLPGPGAVGRYRTLALREVHSLGPDGRSVLHRTVHLIRAVDPLAGYPYLLDVGGLRLDVLRGGRAGPRRHLGGRLAVDVEFHHPLYPGEAGSFEYVCHFDPAAAVVRRFRRGTSSRLENVELEVRFDPAYLPERIWWAVWPDPHTERPLRQERVYPDLDGSVRRFVEVLERRVVGFRWRYPR